jgi:hypothetical protein
MSSRAMLPALALCGLLAPAQREPVAVEAPPATFELRGLVQPDDRPPPEGLQGISVRVGLSAGGSVLYDASVATDEQGRFSAALPAAEAPDSATVFAFARIDQPGYQERSVWTLSVAPAEVVLPCIPGATVRIRVVDDEGRPVESSELRMDVPGEDPAALQQRLRTFGRAYRGSETPVRAHEPGVFDLHFTASETVELRARASGVGAESLTLPLDVERHGVAVDLVLHRRGVLEGRLQDPGGHPIPGVELVACPRELIEDPTPAETAARAAPERERQCGLYVDHAVTDEAGGFAFGGLQEGSYFLLDRGGRIDIPRQAYGTGSTSIALVVEGYRLFVRVVDPSGKPLANRAPYCSPLAAEADPGAAPATGAARAEPGAPRAEPGPARVEPGLWSFDVEPGARYAVGWLDERHALVEETLSIEPGSYWTERTLELGRAGLHGQLLVTVAAAAGDDPPDRWSTFEITLHSIGTGAQIDSFQYQTRGGPDAPPALFVLPPGRYEVRAESAAGPRRDAVRTRRGRASEITTVREGGVTALRLLIPPDERLEDEAR